VTNSDPTSEIVVGYELSRSAPLEEGPEMNRALPGLYVVVSRRRNPGPRAANVAACSSQGRALAPRCRAGLSGEKSKVCPTAKFAFDGQLSMPLSPPAGGEGRVRGADEGVCGAAHLTLPGERAGAPPSPPEGRRGATSGCAIQHAYNRLRFPGQPWAFAG
jgi:hypothetical protein